MRKNDLLLQALQGCNSTSRPPIWLMRQAGRYMPEYRAIRSRYSFLEMCHQPELAAEITQLPIRVFGMDAAILFSDILVIAEAFGVGLRFDEGVGPIIERPLQTEQDVEALPVIDARQALGYVEQAIRLLKSQLAVPLIGFSGAPFTVASYMIEGKSSKDLKKTKRWMLTHPKSFHALLDKIAESTIHYLLMQAEAGADVLQIFDSWANVLAYPQFEEFSLAYLEKILKGIRKKNKEIPVILFCRGSSVFAESLARINPTAISLDWNCDLQCIRRQIPSTVALQGNLDPDVLYAPKEILQKEVGRLLRKMEGDPSYIFNLGHGIFPDIPTDSVKVLVECVKG